MTVDQNLIPVAPGGAEISSRFGFLSTEEINEAPGEEPDDLAETVPGVVMAPPVLPAWPRIYPGI